MSFANLERRQSATAMTILEVEPTPDGEVKEETSDTSPAGELVPEREGGSVRVPSRIETRRPLEAKEKGSMEDFLVSLFECPVCFGYIMPPVLQCARGHLLCSFCRQKVTLCPVCRISMTNIRSLAMEKVATKLIFPCKHSQYGCRERVLYGEKLNHEEDCEWRPYNCPYPDDKCKWKGPLKDVYLHLVHAHENVITMEGNDIIFLATNVNLEGALDWTMVQSCHGRHFLLSLEKIYLGEGCQQYFTACRMIGTMKDAAKFMYNISLDANNRTLRWQSKPRSIRESFASFTHADFLVLNKMTVEQFSEDGNLALNVVIKKVQDPDEN
ncbi:probable E3 ubiquitin-protein ligase sinah isoform X2 [Drosophila eugracilis]|uniref:probable E3 ubiquitin-protein ligase sinah isoform X2 n=1 Tax=Drosophila eugracilis TaxID=29029 RepID=UPI0007E879A8|nr:probable E3 ubiquitin-protein ligase sinah isoform X2 [Drosophila eugracilis]